MAHGPLWGCPSTRVGGLLTDALIQKEALIGVAFPLILSFSDLHSEEVPDQRLALCAQACLDGRCGAGFYGHEARHLKLCVISELCLIP